MYEIVSLINEILPPLTQWTIYPPVSYGIQSKSYFGKHSLGSSIAKQEDTSGTMPEISAQETLFRHQPELFGTVWDKFFSSFTTGIWLKCEFSRSSQIPFCYHKLMYLSTPDMLQSLLQVTNISSFSAGVLTWKDHKY